MKLQFEINLKEKKSRRVEREREGETQNDIAKQKTVPNRRQGRKGGEKQHFSSTILRALEKRKAGRDREWQRERKIRGGEGEKATGRKLQGQ